eukprot:scaffold37606_cov27-Tisochrysis_lutea.AAC.2
MLTERIALALSSSARCCASAPFARAEALAAERRTLSRSRESSSTCLVAASEGAIRRRRVLARASSVLSDEGQPFTRELRQGHDEEEEARPASPAIHPPRREGGRGEVG